MPSAFHVTFASRLKSILSQGVVPGKKRIWSNAVGVPLGERGRIYFSLTMAAALRWAMRQSWEFRDEAKADPVVIVEFKCPEQVEADAQPGNVMHSGHEDWRTSRSPIPAADIIRIIPFSHEQLGALLAAEREQSAQAEAAAQA